MTRSADAPMATVRGVSHIALEVSDLARSIAFYEETLGLEVFLDERTDPDRPNIKGLVGGFAIELAQNIAPPDRLADHGDHGAPSGRQCVTFAVADASTAFERFKAAGHVEADEITHLQGAQLFFAKDPDGYVFELIQFPEGMEVLADLAPLLRAEATST